MDQFDVEKIKEGAGTVLEGAGSVLKEGKKAFNGMNDFFNFNNPGTKLKSFVRALNKINLALSVLSCFIWLIVAFASELIFDAFWLFLVGYVVIAVYYLLSYLSCLFLYAFAEMVENSTILVQLKKSENK